MKGKPLATFSGLERVARCPGSVALPHANYSTGYSTRGTALHAYLEAIPALGPEAALDVVDDEWRDAAKALDLTGLDTELQLGAEVSLAYDCENDTGRELGRGTGRDYTDVAPSEVPGTLDVVGFDRPRRRGLVIDWKMGWQAAKKSIRKHWQLFAGGLVVARAYDLDEVEVQQIHVSEGERPWVKKVVLTAMELDDFAGDVQHVYREAKEMRATAEAGRIPNGLHAGDWCTYCGARDWCPVRTSLIRAVVSGDETDGLLRVTPMPAGMIPEAYRRVKAAKKILRTIEQAVFAAAAEAPILVGKDDDGTEHWLGQLVDEGNELIDGRVAHAVIAEKHGAAAADAAVTYETSKVAIDRVLKPLAERGKFAGMKREVLEAIRAKGGAVRPPREGVREYAVKPR